MITRYWPSLPISVDVAADGSIDYYTWGDLGDSISDYGRLVQLYVKAVTYCSAPLVWQGAHFPAVARMGDYMYGLWEKAANPKTAPPVRCECECPITVDPDCDCKCLGPPSSISIPN